MRARVVAQLFYKTIWLLQNIFKDHSGIEKVLLL